MKNLTQLPWSGKSLKAKNDNTLGRMQGGIRSRIGSMSLKNTSLFGVILTLLLTLGVGEMWAGAGWWNDGGVVLKFDLNGSEISRTLNSGSAGGATSLGTVTTSMKLKTFTANVWKDGSGNICSAEMYYRVKNSGGTVVLDKTGTATSASWKSNSGNNQVWEKSSINVDLLNGGLAPGTYTFECWFKATGNASSSSGCGTTWWYSNNSNNYSYTFIVPSKNLTVAGAANGNTVSGSVTGITKGTAYTITATPTTGYNFSSWSATSGSSSISIGNTSSASTTVTFSNYSNNATVTASFTPKTTTIALNNAGATTSGSTSVTATYGEAMPAITLPTKTGYTFGGYWGAPGGSGPKYYNADGSSNATWLNTESTYTLYAAWAENKSTVTLVASPSGKGTFQVGGETVTSTLAGVATTPAVTAMAISGYRFSSWSISGGASISSTTDNPTTVTGGGAGTAATLTATFVEDLTYYTLQFGARKVVQDYGSVTAKDDSDNPLTSGSTYLSGTSVTLTATATDDDYKFDSWYPGWTTGDPVSTENPLTFSLSENTKRYAHFVQKTTSITLNKNGGSGGTAGPVTATHGSTTLSTNPLVTPDKSGYTFTGYWTESSGGVKVIDTDGTLVASVSGYTKSGNKKWDYDDPTLTLYAQWTENKYTVSITGGTTSSTTAGVSTTGTATVSLPAGKKFTGWTLGSGVTLVSGTTSSATITFHASQTSSVTAGFADRAGVKMYFAKPTALGWGTLYAYAWQNGGSATNGDYPGVELSTTETINCVTYYVYQYYTEADGIGGAATGNSAWNRIIFGCNNDAKKTGDLTISNGHYYYVNSTTTGKDAAIASAWYIKGTMNSWGETDVMTHACATNTATKDIELSGGTNYSFKVYDEVNNNWWTTGNTDINNSFTATTLSSSGADMVIKPAVTGDYTFTVTSTNGTPELAISFPEFYSIVGSFNEWNTEADELGFSGDVGTAVINLSGSTTAYEFKVIDKGAWSGTASTLNITGTVSNQAISVGSGNNINLTADIYPDGDYTFTYNKSTYKLGVTYPSSYVVTFGKRTGGSTVTAKINNTTAFNSGTKIKPSTSVTFAQTAATGYTFEGWYNASTGGTRVSTSSSYTTTISAATTIYSNYTPNDYVITLDKNTGSANGSVTATYNSSSTKSFTAVTKTGYVCTGYWTASSGGYKVVNIDGTLAPYSSNISTYLNTNGTWKKTTATTLYAQWTPETYTITLDKNGGTSNGTATATYDSNKLTSITAPTKTGYHTVDGYYKEGGTTNKISDLSGNLQASTTYTNASSQWSSTSNQTLYAKWAANTYTIAFNANDANYVGEATGTTASIAATYGVSYTLTANGFSRAGYTFNGWNTNADGTSGTNYSNSQTGVSNLTATNGATVTLYAKWTGLTYTVSFNKGAGTCAVSSSTVTFGSPYSDGTGLSGSLPEVTPPSGSVFNGWYDAPTGGNKIDDETLVTTASDHTLYARYTQRDRVYFYNNLGWSDVYVTYDPRDWSDTYGTGNSGKIYHHMTQIAGTDIWYDDLPEAVLSDWKWFVAFNSTQLGTVGESGTWEWFNSGNAVYRHDFDSYATMFVPESAKTDNWKKNDNSCTYYSSSWNYDAAGGGHGENYRQSVGYWMRYNDEKSGYSITGTWDGWANSTSLKASEQGATTFAVTKVLDANTTYEFLLYKEFTHNTHNHIFTNTTTMTSANCTNIEFTTTNAKYSTLETNHAKITTTVAGEYVFKLTTGTDGKLKMSVEYPISTNDYRVLYTWNDGSSSHTHASEIIKGAASTEKTISVFVHKASDVPSRSLKIQQCTGISGVGVPTWTDRNTIDLTSVSESGVHNFIITQPATGYATGAYSEKYTGNYYIRTESADGGWDYYLNHTDNVMTRSDYSLTQTLSDPFSHYYCRYIESTSIDITYQIATDYSPCVSEVLVGDATIGGVGNTRLPAPANVRFSWNEQTNALRRAYLKSAQGDGNTRYLVLHGADNKIRNDDATGTTISADGGRSLAANELLFTDQGNWVYQVSLKAVPGAKVSLIANYNSADRYLVGGAESFETIVGGSGSSLYGITAIFDFKTNRLLTAWTPSDDITEALSDVDLLLIRHAQEEATAISFGLGGSLSAKRVTGAIRLDYNDLFGHVANWTSSSRPLLKYFISFPFDVNVSDVFGLNSAYGDAYVIQRYAGDERAAKGFFRGDGTTTFWEDMPHDGVMKANVGYCVILDNDYFNGNETGAIWQNKSAGSSVYLYFPSAGDVGGITATSKTITVPAQTCTIDRTYTNSGDKTLSHTITDSHWNMMGVPIFNTHRGEATSGTPGAIFVSPENDAINFRYFYSWNSANNKFSITSAVGYDFKSMHSYMVQYTGNVTFTGGTTPSSVAARRMPLEKKYTIDLQALDSNDEMINRTYVELREQACDTFALSEDVYMESNNLAINIYTYAGNYDVAANVLSVGNHVVPVGLDVRKTGTYSLSMPSEFSGSVYLIDQETGERTNLAIGDVTIDLEKGTYDERFLLEINVDEEIVTDVEYTTGEGSLKDGKPHKFLQNGILYLLKDGVVYDAQGHLVK